MKVELTDYTHNPEQTIAEKAAICYDAKTTEDANDRRIKKLMNLKHLSTLRFAYATFYIGEISRVCSHELVRTAHNSYLQRSQRYVNEENAVYILPPNFQELSPELKQRVMDHQKENMKLYTDLITEGKQRKEDARYILQQNVATSMYMTGNFHAWVDFLRNRTHKAAQWEIRDVANTIQSELINIAPNVFKHIW